jgi:L-ascorbate oxidase
MLPLVVHALLATWSAPRAFALTVRHDATFTPDHILRVTNENIDIACDSHLSVIVNGTTPGPALRLAPGTASWIRVYNDVEDQNLTMVCPPSLPRRPVLMAAALAWPGTENGPFL